RADATLVFYMAVQGLEVITATLTSLGRAAREPALVIERATMAGERVVAGHLGDIATLARAARVESPAVLGTGPTGSSAAGPRAVGAALAGTERAFAVEV